MKICFITTGDIKNIATAKRALGLANPLNELGWSVSILMEDTTENRHRVDMECSKGIEVHYFKGTSMQKERRLKNEMIKLIDPDFLYLCAFVTRNIVGINHRSKKVVEHSELQSGIPDNKGLKKAMHWILETASLYYSDYVLNASVYLQKVFKQRVKYVPFKELQMYHFPYAYNSSVIKVQPIDYTEDRNKAFKGKCVFVFLGTITRNYGAFTILEAAKQLRGLNFKVQMLGRGRHYDEAKKYVAENNLSDYVEMPGFIKEEDISYYFSLASAFLSPMNDTIQDWARCPSKLYLYLPFQKPVITCKIGELYQVLGNEGLYYKTGDAESMAQAMKKVIDGQVAKLDIAPWRHSWEARAKDLNLWLNA